MASRYQGICTSTNKCIRRACVWVGVWQVSVHSATDALMTLNHGSQLDERALATGSICARPQPRKLVTAPLAPVLMKHRLVL